MKSFLFSCSLLFSLSVIAQPTKLELGMKRNAVQTVMGSAEIDSYQKSRTVYMFMDSVFCTIDFDASELCSGFFWSGKDENTLTKTIVENGFAKRDSITFYAKDFTGILKKDTNTTALVYRFIPVIAEQQIEKKSVRKKENPEDILPKENPFYGLTILGARVWEAKAQ